MDNLQKNKNFWGLVRITAFILLFCIVFTQVSYLMRPGFQFSVSYNGLKEEEAPIDVVFIGGSSTLVFWSPMLAYERYGISSWSFSDDAMACALMQGLIEESRAFCKPELYVIDLRGFELMESDPSVYTEGYFRHYTDSLPYSMNRAKMIQYASQFAKFDYVPQALHLDLIYYHGEWRSRNMYYWNRDYNSIMKGQVIPLVQTNPVQLNSYEEVTSCASLSNETVTVLTDLINYLEENQIPALFLLNSFAFRNEQVRQTYNSIFNILEQRNMPYLDTNLHYGDIGLDESKDFYDVNHVNVLGSEKYTDWLSCWLKEKYELTDHRGEAEYAAWEKDLPAFQKEFMDAKKHYLNQYEIKDDDYAQ